MKLSTLHTIFLVVIMFSCNAHSKEQSVKKGHNDSVLLEDSASLAIGNQSLQKKIEDCLLEGIIQIPPVLPDSILNNHKKLYQYYRFTYIPSLHPNGFFSYDSIPFDVFGKISICSYQRDPQRISRKLFKYIPHYFVKKIFSGKIINKHQQDFIDQQELIKNWDSDRRGCVDEYWNDLAENILYKLPEDGVATSPYFHIRKVLFSEKYTLFVFDVSDGSGRPYGINFMCTYDHDGELIDGIETGLGITDDGFGVVPFYSYSYFDYKGFYHIIKVETDRVYLQNNDKWTERDYRTKGWNNITTYNEVTEHYKYKLTDEGQFVLVKKDRKKIVKPIYE